MVGRSGSSKDQTKPIEGRIQNGHPWSSALRIREGFQPPVQQTTVIEDKGKTIEAIQVLSKSPNQKVLIPIQGKNDGEASSSGLKLKVNRFINPTVCDSIDLTTGIDLNENLISAENFDPVTCGNEKNFNKPFGIDMLMKGDNLAETQNYSNPCTSTARVKVNPEFISAEMSDDGIAIKLNEDLVNANALVLKNSLVVKVLGDNIPTPVCCWELRK